MTLSAEMWSLLKIICEIPLPITCFMHETLSRLHQRQTAGEKLNVVKYNGKKERLL